MRLKPSTLHSAKLRKSARGEECTLQIPGVCNGNPETTVLCHLDVLSESGMGFKCSDLSAAYGCSDCHDAVDGRVLVKGFAPEDFWSHAARGIVRTHIRMIETGVLKL